MNDINQPGAPNIQMIPSELAVLPTGDEILFPYMVLPVAIKNEKWVKMIEEVVSSNNRTLGIFAIKSLEEGVTSSNLYSFGTAALIVKMLRMPDTSIQVLLQGISRIKINKFIQEEPYIKVVIEPIIESKEKTTEMEGLARSVVSLFHKMIQLAPNIPSEVGIIVSNLPEISQQADFIASHLRLTLAEKQEILEAIDLIERLKKLNKFLLREIEILEIGEKIQSQVKGEMGKSQRQFYLREQLKAIQKELGEEDDRTAEINEFRKKLEEAQVPEEVKKEAEREINRLASMHPSSAEYTVSKTYLDWIVNLPWRKETTDNLDIVKAKQILDEDHFGLEKPKERILDYLAVRSLKGDMKGPILCFAGPPGTGKTSLGKSIARALGRKFVRISLGGVRDEAEIRGHRRTYVGALPGRIIQGIRRAGSNNPVFMLDEIDKVGTDFRGDPSAALLEVLDPEQNNSFSDHYLDLPFDLSKVMFITTANVLHTIPPALLDRMEVLKLSGYMEGEKLQIAKQFLIPKQRQEHGLTEDKLIITDEALLTIIREYTREAGLRNLEREIATLCRKSARKIIEGKAETVIIKETDLYEYLGPKKFRYEIAGEKDEIGVTTGLAWTPDGGDVLFVEAKAVSGKGNLILTGSLGDVMKESAQAALTYTRSRAELLNLPPDFYEKWDIHIHVPSGGIPKDGPSAGITITTSIISALTKRPVRKDVAMTGEITIRGKVLPIGGVKDKVLAAHRAGIKTILLPKENEKDLEEISQPIKDQIKFIFVDNMDEVLKEALKEEKIDE